MKQSAQAYREDAAYYESYSNAFNMTAFILSLTGTLGYGAGKIYQELLEEWEQRERDRQNSNRRNPIRLLYFAHNRNQQNQESNSIVNQHSSIPSP